MKLNATDIAGRMRLLPRRHRLAHLRALIRRQPAGSTRGDELAALLRDETSAPPSCEGRAV